MKLLAAKHPFVVQQVLNSLKKDFPTGSCDSDLPTRVILLCVTKIINWILLQIAYSAARCKSPMEPLDVLSARHFCMQRQVRVW